MTYHASLFKMSSGNDVEWHHEQREPGIQINLDDSGAKTLQNGCKMHQVPKVRVDNQ